MRTLHKQCFCVVLPERFLETRDKEADIGRKMSCDLASVCVCVFVCVVMLTFLSICLFGEPARRTGTESTPVSGSRSSSGTFHKGVCYSYPTSTDRDREHREQTNACSFL